MILLAGGDVDVGWRAFEAVGAPTGRRAALLGRRRARSACPPAPCSWGRRDGPRAIRDDPFATWGFAPFVVDAHAEADGLGRRCAPSSAPAAEGARGIGIPSGGGLLYHADGTLEAVRHTLAEVTLRDGEL